ncbi:MAG: YdcF family protein [Bacteroidota bacterium]
MYGLDFIFYKTFLQFVMPLGVAFIGFLTALIFFFKCKSKRTGFILFMSSIAWLWLWSMPLWSDFIRNRLESQFKYRPVSTYPEADAIVVLGGGIRGYAGSAMPSLDLNGAADRELFAAQLFHAGKSHVVILSGGADPIIRTGISALAMKEFLLILGVPGASIRIGSGSRNTVENMQEVGKMMKEMKGDSILLVTSALHMPRAVWLFARSGLHVIPAPADFESIPVPFRLIRLLPDAEALGNSSRAAKELIGLWSYKLIGY